MQHSEFSGFADLGGASCVHDVVTCLTAFFRAMDAVGYHQCCVRVGTSDVYGFENAQFYKYCAPLALGGVRFG
ncbi:hypothetical protein [Dyadobacter sp. SG02]|uniref:hypothetical protein n=1 Tax=Dyadobacter sp. SG02 TaxID=1855291 RepID=UPI00115F98F9|nr:hypothetical protein [Dyadobacter sp. SG02]